MTQSELLQHHPACSRTQHICACDILAVDLREFNQIAPSWTRQSPTLRLENDIDQRSNP
jgi:hypothetical protein